MARLLLAVALLLGPLAAFAQFAGHYVYQGAQGAVTLTLQQRDGAVSGSMRGIDGSVMEFDGRLRDGGKGVAGTARAGGHSGIFAAKFLDGRLALIIADVDPATGRAKLDSTLELAFERAAPGSSPPPAARQPGVGTQQAAAPSSERDPALVGHWVHSNVYRSGDFSGTSSRQLVVQPDGTYQIGHGSVQVSSNHGFGRSQGEDFTTGQWRTQNRIVYVREGGSQWVPYARYYVEGGSMLLTFENGSKQLWQRR